MAGGGAEDPLEPLQYQTMVLKVSIHCEGCRKKVKKVLQSIEGVYKTTIDAQNHKVTVTGNVEAGTLVKRLLKTGKHAELWPAPDPIKPNHNNNNNGSTAKKKKNKAAGPQPTDKSLSFPSGEKEATGKQDAAAAEPAEDDVIGKEAQKPDGSPAPQPEKAAPAAAGGGGGGKKKGKKGQSNNGGGGEAAAEKQEGGKAAAPPPTAGGLLQPRPQSYNFYNPVTPPAYVLSYSTAQPSYGASAYFPVQQSSYVYPHPASYCIPPAAAAVEDETFSADSDDVCSIM